jgi:hypothetical protein
LDSVQLLEGLLTDLSASLGGGGSSRGSTRAGAGGGGAGAGVGAGGGGGGRGTESDQDESHLAYSVKRSREKFLDRSFGMERFVSSAGQEQDQDLDLDCMDLDSLITDVMED